MEKIPVYRLMSDCIDAIKSHYIYLDESLNQKCVTLLQKLCDTFTPGFNCDIDSSEREKIVLKSSCQKIRVVVTGSLVSEVQFQSNRTLSGEHHELLYQGLIKKIDPDLLYAPDSLIAQ